MVQGKKLHKFRIDGNVENTSEMFDELCNHIEAISDYNNFVDGLKFTVCWKNGNMYVTDNGRKD